MDSERMHSLFALTLAGGEDSEDSWKAISELHSDGSREIFEFAAGWLRTGDPAKRARAASVLGQLRRAGQADGEPYSARFLFREESRALIETMLEGERHTEVLAAAIAALGHLGDANAIPIVLRYLDHNDPDVRFHVAFALGCFADDPQAIRGLIALTADPTGKVRDWAVFGLGVQGDADSPEIRAVLWRCADDPEEVVREEAVAGLAKRGDLRVLPQVLAMLDKPEITLCAGEAAGALLGLDPIPPEWTGADIIAALDSKFSQAGR